MKKPWELNSALIPEHLKQLASLIRNIRDEVIDKEDQNLGDTARSTGLRAYECCRTQIIRAAKDRNKWSWLGIVTDDGRFTFSINSVPIRLYRGRPSNPQERRLIPSIEALQQMSLLPIEDNTIASILWFFAVEVDNMHYVERISLTGFSNGMQISLWEIPLDEKVSAFSTVDDELPEPIKIEKAKVSIKSVNHITQMSQE